MISCWLTHAEAQKMERGVCTLRQLCEIPFIGVEVEQRDSQGSSSKVSQVSSKDVKTQRKEDEERK